MIDAAKHRDEKKRVFWAEGGEDTTVSPDGLATAWYVRGSGDAGAARAALPEARLLERADAPAGEFALLTGPMTRQELDEKLAGIEPLSVFRVLD